MRKRFLFSVILFTVLVTVGLGAVQGHAGKFKILVVMSYEETFPWCQEIKLGIENIFSPLHQITFFYMDTKINLQQGPKKAEQAFDLFQAIQPDGVIAADDNAQSMFVVPYLKAKVATPVMFCGVNAQPELYGYPARNVSGILERLHIAETIAFAQQLVPSIKTVGFIAKDSPAVRALQEQVNREYTTYSANCVGFKMPATQQDTLSMAKELKGLCGLLFMETLQGVTDAGGRPLEEKEIMPQVAETFEKPVVGSNLYAVRFAALCAVVKTGREQGATAARMLLKAMQGTSVDQIPITVNKYGKRYINATVMRKMGIKPKPIVLQGAKLVRTQE